VDGRWEESIHWCRRARKGAGSYSPSFPAVSIPFLRSPIFEQVEKVVLTADIGSWSLHLTLRPDSTLKESVWYVKDKAVPLSHTNASICRFVAFSLFILNSS
jgi:hypothetical protein